MTYGGRGVTGERDDARGIGVVSGANCEWCCHARLRPQGVSWCGASWPPASRLGSTTRQEWAHTEAVRLVGRTASGACRAVRAIDLGRPYFFSFGCLGFLSCLPLPLALSPMVYLQTLGPARDAGPDGTTRTAVWDQMAAGGHLAR